MKTIKSVLIIFCLLQSTNLLSQDAIFYIQIEDSKIVPDISVDKETGILEVKAKGAELNDIYSKYEISEFELAFPGIPKNSLKNVYLVKCNDRNLGIELKNRYKNEIPRLEFISEAISTYTPNDYSLAGGQTYLDLVNAKNAWDFVLDIPKIGIAISDTYFDMYHEDLDMNLIGGDNDPYNVIYSEVYHGTFVAGLAGAVTDNNIGLASIGFDSELFVSSVRSDSEVLSIAEAGYRVINCSWINSCTFSTVQLELYEYIRDDLNTIVVFGAGNSGSNHCGNNNPSYPASYYPNIAVTSVGHLNDIDTPGTPASNWKDVHENIIGDSLSAHKHHPTIDICAPGYNIITTDIMGSGYGGKSSGNYSNGWGTSFAAPQVAATLALIISLNPCLSADDAVDILLDNADNSIYSIDENAQYIGRLGAGRLDVEAAVEASAETATIYLEDLTLSVTQTIQDNYAIRVINNVSITSGTDITLKTRKEVSIAQNFEVASGGILLIDVDDNNLSCN